MLVERVLEASKGYWIAAYACPVGELGDEYIGYFKICGARPSSYFEASGCVIKGSCGDRATESEAAVEAALAFAREQIANMPRTADLDACREMRAFYSWEMETIASSPHLRSR